MVIMLIYVDDLLLTGNDAVMIDELKHILNSDFKIKYLRELDCFLRFEILRSNERIFLSQRNYALELIKDIGLGGAKPIITPMVQNMKLTTLEYDTELQQYDNDEVLTEEKGIFQKLIGGLIYLTHTRPDTTYALHHLSQFMQQPKRSHLEAALRVVRYIKKDPRQGILLAASSSYQLNAYCESDWPSYPMTRRSITGFCNKLGNSLISQRSKKQNTIARSPAEVEYKSMAITVAKLFG
ncbi:uncharacterized mitochondrial protein AtMg00810-like [Gossypium hirsutum]|uniref:Uncharacterized mitochondrial protein AtMg00810-like n=1 Tax=Gossypium hirsutum TaxID=3635 RepID=A0A1U8NMV0_GOSHI|nr:uncharacterized mitochondrial protein AtMg00810-like [Gossypium hirsutum]